MSDLNQVAVSGNLGAAMEVRYTGSGLAVGRFSVAVNERRKQPDGSWGDVANWIPCILFDKRAEGLEPYLQKGTQVALSGRLHQSSWEKDGRKSSRIEVYVDDLKIMNSRRERKAEDAAPEPAAQAPAAGCGDALYGEDMPF